MNKKNKFIKIALVILLSFFSLNYMIKADSGWDSSYDSDWGSSDWGSSDWGGSSSWDDDWGSSGYSSGGSSSSLDTIIIFIIVVVIIIVASKNQNHQSSISTITRVEIPQSYRDSNKKALEEISKEIPNFDNDSFCSNVIETFKNVQNAWSEFDYKKLRELLTDELYNTYHMQLKALKAKKQKNVMSDFKPLEVLITNFTKNKDKTYTFDCVLHIAFYDYVENANGDVLRGDKKHMIDMLYTLTFVGSLDTKNNKCPNCNAPLDDTASNVCPYCNSTIVSKNHKLVLSKKQTIKQGWYQ